MDTEENNFVKLDERVEPISEEQTTSNHIRLRQSKTLLEKNDDGSSKVDKLKNILRNNILGCDLVVCVFIAALKSFRVDQCLRPFPQCFINENNEKDFVSLKNACDKIPPLTDFLRLPSKNISKDVLDLLTWLFIDSGLPNLRAHSLENLPLSVINHKARINVLPQYVFEVQYNSKFEETWRKRVCSKDVFYAFHGSSITNFYSILKFGLQQHFGRGREVLFGNGIYLSNEISVCTNYAPFGETWKNSISGERHSIIAVCEVINDEENVKCKDEKNKKRSINQNSYGEIPDNYFVVTNSELVRVKYLLVYSHKASSVVKSFIKKNLLWIVIIFYLITLVLIGFLSGPSSRRYMKYFSSQE